MNLREKEKHLSALLEEVDSHYLLVHPWLNELRALSDHDFLQTFREYVYSSSIFGYHFASYVKSAITLCESSHLSKILQKNLDEELGLDESSPIPHTILFQAMVDELELASTRLDSRCSDVPAEERLLLQTILSGTEKFQLLGALLIGSEWIVPKLYKPILDRVTLCESYHLPASTDFFDLHVSCDQTHGQEAVAGLLSEIRSADDFDSLRKGAVTALNCREQILTRLFTALQTRLSTNQLCSYAV